MALLIFKNYFKNAKLMFFSNLFSLQVIISILFEQLKTTTLSK